jgi:hypothetical protein
MGSFYIRKFCAQLFCAYVLGLYFSGARLLAQNCWRKTVGAKAASRTLMKMNLVVGSIWLLQILLARSCAKYERVK